MEITKLLFYGILVIIIILVAFNLKVQSLSSDLSKACVENYSSFVESHQCPCKSPEKGVLNLSSLNLTNVSV